MLTPRAHHPAVCRTDYVVNANELFSIIKKTDESVTVTEAARLYQTLLDTHDANHDGQLSIDEVALYLSQHSVASIKAEDVSKLEDIKLEAAKETSGELRTAAALPVPSAVAPVSDPPSLKTEEIARRPSASASSGSAEGQIKDLSDRISSLFAPAAEKASDLAA